VSNDEIVLDDNNGFQNCGMHNAWRGSIDIILRCDTADWNDEQ
jgi:hypothetical protein